MIDVHAKQSHTQCFQELLKVYIMKTCKPQHSLSWELFISMNIRIKLNYMFNMNFSLLNTKQNDQEKTFYFEQLILSMCAHKLDNLSSNITKTLTPDAHNQTA